MKIQYETTIPSTDPFLQDVSCFISIYGILFASVVIMVGTLAENANESFIYSFIPSSVIDNLSKGTMSASLVTNVTEVVAETEFQTAAMYTKNCSSVC